MDVTNISFSQNREQLLQNLDPVNDKMFELIEHLQCKLRLWRDIDSKLSSPIDIEIQAPRGMLTDLISVSDNVLEKIGIKRRDYIFAPVLHDSIFKWPIAICTTPGHPQSVRLTQKECDAIFKAILLWEGLDKGRAHFMYKLLRNWGWIAWLRWRLWSLMGWLK